MAVIMKSLLPLVFLSLMFRGSVGECAVKLRNTVLKAGQPLVFSVNRSPTSQFHVCPSSENFNIKKEMTNADGSLQSIYRGTYQLDENGLTIFNCSSFPENDRWSTSGVYMLTDPDNDCNTSAKVAVVESGPTCDCRVSTTNPPVTIFTATIQFADTTKNEMFPICTWTKGNQVLKTEKPLPRRLDRYFSTTTCSYERPGRSLGVLADLKCTITFSPPPAYPIPNMDTEAPDYSDSCDFNFKCK